jgi:hypothetical protein
MAFEWFKRLGESVSHLLGFEDTECDSNQCDTHIEEQEQSRQEIIERLKFIMATSDEMLLKKASRIFHSPNTTVSATNVKPIRSDKVIRWDPFTNAYDLQTLLLGLSLYVTISIEFELKENLVSVSITFLPNTDLDSFSGCGYTATLQFNNRLRNATVRHLYVKCLIAYSVFIKELGGDLLTHLPIAIH